MDFKKKGITLNGKDKQSFFSELASLLNAGLSFSRSFQIIIESSDRHKSCLFNRIFADIISGDSLWNAMHKCQTFSSLDCNVTRIGEESGKLVETLDFLADYYRQRNSLKKMCINALSYPAITICIAMAVLIFMLLVVIPMFEQVYARMGGELPRITVSIVSLSKQFPMISAILIFAGLAVFCLHAAYKEHTGYRKFTSSLILHIPLFREIIKRYQISRFCRIMYLLVSSGIPLLKALKFTGDSVTFYPYQNAIGSICEHIENGGNITSGIDHHEKLFGKKMTALLKVGEETGTLPRMLHSLGEDTEKSLQHLIRQANNMIEPFLILGIGTIVAFILIAMYLPMFKIGMAFR